jgi:hypothetical protein
MAPSERTEQVFLTSKGLERASQIKGENFTFVVGNSQYQCMKFQAVFVSRAASRIICSDNTCDRLVLDGFDDENGVFEEINSFMQGRPIIVRESNAHELQKIAQILENDELVARTVDFQFDGEEMTSSNCGLRISRKHKSGCSIDDEIKFAASHFYELDTSELMNVDCDVIEAIVSHKDLCLLDEEGILEFIWSLGESYSVLYGYVECRFLTLEGIEKFLSRLSEDTIDARLWGSVCRRLRCELADRSLRDSRFDRKHFGYNEKNPFDGILTDMGKKCGGNVHDNGVIVISVSSDSTRNSKCLVDRNWNDQWYSGNGDNSWVQFDFKERKVSVEHYTLKSGRDFYPIRWELEGSNDQSNWLSLDKKEVYDLVGGQVAKTYACSNENCKNSFRFIRIRQFGPNNSGNYYFALNNVEFFGTLTAPKP